MLPSRLVRSTLAVSLPLLSFLLPGGAIAQGSNLPGQRGSADREGASKSSVERKSLDRKGAAAEKDAVLDRILSGKEPRSVKELKRFETHVQALIQRVQPCLLSIGGGCGVLVDTEGEPGLILTAGHVILSAGRRFRVTTHEGKRLFAKSLGANHRTDTGMLRLSGDRAIAEAPKGVPLGKPEDLSVGQWCLMIGHPAGRKNGRMPPARLGRIQRLPTRIGSLSGFLVTDCTMESGDSGGPIFDMQGRLIGINSRIMASLATNMHVPMEAFAQDWKRLLKGEVIGQRRGRRTPRTRAEDAGLRFSGSLLEAVVSEVVKGSPASKAGFRKGDRILRYAGRVAGNPRFLLRRLRYADTAKALRFRVERDGKELELELRLRKESRRKR